MRSKRLKIYLDYFNIHNSVNWNTLSNLANTSESTVRRDLKQLEKNGLVKIEHGGATYIGNHLELTMPLRYKKNIEEKDEIGKKAASLIRDNDCIFIDAGSTTEKIVHYIKAKNILVVTNGINIAHSLIKKQIKTIVLGGEIRPKSFATVGQWAVKKLQDLFFHISFLGTNAISKDFGYSTPDLRESNIKQTVISRSKKSYILADSSKFNLETLHRFANIKNLKIISSNSYPKEYEKFILKLKKEEKDEKTIL